MQRCWVPVHGATDGMAVHLNGRCMRALATRGPALRVHSSMQTAATLCPNQTCSDRPHLAPAGMQPGHAWRSGGHATTPQHHHTINPNRIRHQLLKSCTWSSPLQAQAQATLFGITMTLYGSMYFGTVLVAGGLDGERYIVARSLKSAVQCYLRRSALSLLLLTVDCVDTARHPFTST